MAIYTVGNKPINFKTSFSDPYYKEWLGEKRVNGLYNGRYPLSEDSLEECSDRYLCLTCDFLSNSGNNSSLKSKITWSDPHINIPEMDAGFRAGGYRAYFGNTLIENADLNKKNKIKYIIDLDFGKGYFYFNGVYIGEKRYEEPYYYGEMFNFRDFTRKNYALAPVYPAQESWPAEVTISNAKLFHCSDFSIAEKYDSPFSHSVFASNIRTTPVVDNGFIDVLTPPARVQGGSWYGDTYSGAGISACGFGKGKVTGKWLENDMMYNYPCMQIILDDFNIDGCPHGNIEWNASGLSGGLNANVDEYNNYLLVKMLWQPIRRCFHPQPVEDYPTPWNLSIKLNDVETAKIKCYTSGIEGWDTSGYSCTFKRLLADCDQDDSYSYIGSWGIEPFKQLIDLRTGGVSSVFGYALPSYWTSSVNLSSLKYNDTDNFKLYVSSIGPRAYVGGDEQNPSVEYAVTMIRMADFGVSASKLDNISYNDFLSL